MVKIIVGAKLGPLWGQHLEKLAGTVLSVTFFPALECLGDFHILYRLNKSILDGKRISN